MSLRNSPTPSALVGSLVVAVGCFLDPSSAFGVPLYSIVDLGTTSPTHTTSQGFAASPGGVGVGRSVGSNVSTAFSWTRQLGITPLAPLAGRAHAVANGANDSGLVVGTASTTLFGSSPLPVSWSSGVATQLPLPAGQTLGRANDVNAQGFVVGSLNSGNNEVGVVWDADATPSIITATTPGGAVMRTAFQINDSGLVCGFGIDPSNLARNVGVLYDIANGTMSEVPPLAGQNGAIAFGISNTGFVVGASSLNQANGLPFIWSAGTGSVAIPLPQGTTQGSARGVNAAGWVVGTASGAFAVPFLFDGRTTYRVQDLIPAGTGWDLSTNTSSAALGISDNGIIIGTGVLRGAVRAYALVPCTADFNRDGQADFFDYLDFASAFAADGPEADVNSDGQVDFFDYLDFATAFDAGC
ncbi:MAG: hypothetical protein SFZ23_14650 [Planctomycetota bacterium]|nr:hypothetical protein [Planctomycetota bacterium]